MTLKFQVQGTSMGQITVRCYDYSQLSGYAWQGMNEGQMIRISEYKELDEAKK